MLQYTDGSESSSPFELRESPHRVDSTDVEGVTVLQLLPTQTGSVLSAAVPWDRAEHVLLDTELGGLALEPPELPEVPRHGVAST